jgi:Trk K+ transport system NAD-binding subunit
MGARSVAPDAQVVLRLGDDDLAERVARRLGLDASYSVSSASAGVFAAAVMERSIITTVPVGRRVLLIAEVRLGAGCELEGSTVSVIDQPGRCRVFGVADATGDATQLPDPARELHAGDAILIAATRPGLAGVLVAAQARG